MRKVWRGVLLGGAVGAGVRLVQDMRSDGGHDELAVRVGRAAAEAALVGGAVGWFLDRRDRRRLAAMASSSSLGALLGQASERAEAVGHAAEVAVRRVQAAAESAAPVLQDAAGTAIELVQHAADAALPAVAAAAGSAREHLAAATEAARPHVAAASEGARSRAHSAADSARPHVRHVAEVARPHVTAAAEVAAARAADAAEAAKPVLDQARASFAGLAEAGRHRTSA